MMHQREPQALRRAIRAVHVGERLATPDGESILVTMWAVRQHGVDRWSTKPHSQSPCRRGAIACSWVAAALAPPGPESGAENRHASGCDIFHLRKIETQVIWRSGAVDRLENRLKIVDGWEP